LKTARLVFSFDGLTRESDFLALVDLEVLLFAIFPPASLVPLYHILARDSVRVIRAAKMRAKKISSGPRLNRLIFKLIYSVPQPCSSDSAVMTQALRNFLPELSSRSQNGVEWAPPFSLWVFAQRGRSAHTK
jgi:hypothetical protein